MTVSSSQLSGENNSREIPHFTDPPERVVSLVPSMTESMFDLGLGERVVGITDYCVSPPEGVLNLPRIGGTKNPRTSEIIALQPDLVLANWEENTRRTVEKLRQAGLVVWVTFPQTVRDSINVLLSLALIFRNPLARLRVQILELTLDWAITASVTRIPIRYFCPIWYDRTQSGSHWWMTFNRNTYSHDLLSLFACENVFADRERHYPLDADLGIIPAETLPLADIRYPRVSLQEILDFRPELILLPSEPYPFDQSHIELTGQLLRDTPAARDGCVILVHGATITWQGTHLAKSLRELPALLDSCRRS
jgi:iron complex transport system substrate-binding protein